MNKSAAVSNWYSENYKNKSSLRFDSFRLALELTYNNTDNPIIFETGTLRLENDFGAGYSTYIFGECVSKFGGNVITVDISNNNINTCMNITKKFSDRITYIVDDSLNTLKNYTGYIDLLYLDSYDCPIEGDATESQLHNLAEFKLGEKFLHKTSVILIDDINFENGGKAKLTHEYMKENNYTLLYARQQSVWMKI